MIGRVFIFIPIYLVTWFELVLGDTCYTASFVEDVKSCDDFENKWLDARGLKLGNVEGTEDDEGGLGLNGEVEVIKEVDEGMEISISITKETPHGNEPVIKMVADLCANLNDENTPWFPLMKSFNTTLCPIPVKTYKVEEMTINLDYAKDVLTHEYVGEYLVEMALLFDLEVMVCHLIGVAIAEKEC